MEKVFKCCKKNFNNLCCITCYDIFHLSCLDRRSDYKELGGYKIYCSTKCEEKDQKNKRNEENNLKEIRKLKNDIIQRDELMNKLGYEKEDKLNELQKKLHVLEREMKEKDAAYKREKRKTLDFEHDVIETDQKLAIILKENEQIIKKLNEKISDLSHTNEELQTKLKSQVEELTKKDDDLGELKEINKDIVSSIKLQKKNNEDYIRELLRQIETEKEANIKLNEDITELNLLSRNMVSTIATLEAEYNECVQSAKLFRMELEKREHISLKIEEKGIVDIHGSETKPNKILFIAGSHGRHLVNLLPSKLPHSYQFLSILKPNATDNELLETAIHNSENLTKNDVVIFWPNKISSSLRWSFIHRLNFTKTIIITEPYRYDKSHLNNCIYDRNISLIKELHYSGLLCSHLIKVDKIIRRTNYHSDGISINRVGKWFLGQAIIKLINYLCSDNHSNNVPYCTNNTVVSTMGNKNIVVSNTEDGNCGALITANENIVTQQIDLPNQITPSQGNSFLEVQKVIVS